MDQVAGGERRVAFDQVRHPPDDAVRDRQDRLERREDVASHRCAELGAPDLRTRTILLLRLARRNSVETPDPDYAVLEAECGKGTYVRSLARDIGRALGCFGHVSALRRAAVGPFGEETMILLEDLEALCHRAAAGEARLADALMPVETALDDIPALAVTRADAARLHRGQAVLLRGRDAPNSSGTVYVTVAGRLLALAEIGNGELIPKRVFNLTGLTASPGRSNERV